MAAKTILSANQQKLLKILSNNKFVCDFFYLTGGTALSEFYLHHRFSEDLDFFNEQEFDPQAVFVILESVKKQAGIKKIAAEQSFNRNLFFIHLEGGDIIKTEFTFFPFTRMEIGKKIGNLQVDGLLDIAANKIFTIYQKPRVRDFIDLYFILKKERWTIGELVKKARIKFDWHIDPIQLGSRFLEAKELKDYPLMITKIEDDKWQQFFLDEARKLSKDIFK